MGDVTDDLGDASDGVDGMAAARKPLLLLPAVKPPPSPPPLPPPPPVALSASPKRLLRIAIEKPSGDGLLMAGLPPAGQFSVSSLEFTD